MSGSKTTEVDVLDLALADLQSRIRTLLPGLVVAYNPATGRAQVSLAQLSKTTGGQLAKPLVLPSVPVGWMRFAGMTICGTLLPGDEVMLAVLDRAIDRWLVSGGVVPLESGRMHELHDAIALPMLASAKVPRPAGAAAALTIGREDGTATISLTYGPAPGVVTVEAPSIRLGATAVGATAALVRQPAITALIAFANALGAAVPLAAPACTALVTALGLPGTVTVKAAGE